MLCGRYRIVRPVGEGGMGMVYEAVHERLGARVIVKTIAPALADDHEFRARFELEARAAARLASPHVVKVFDVDVTEDGTMFMAMEYLEGENLSTLAARGPLSAEEACTFVVHVCAALEEAHRAGLVHRDIKPSNIFIVGGGRDRFAKVLDFGIAKVLHPTNGSADDLKTQTGIVMGTPRYMAPEQIRGNVVDHRADIWSLGIVLYRLLAHRFPFEDRSGQALMAAVLLDLPEPIERFAPDVPPALARALMLALERDPDHRHASARAFADALAPFARGSEPLRLGAAAPPADAPPASTTVPDAAYHPYAPTERARTPVHDDGAPNVGLATPIEIRDQPLAARPPTSRAPWIIASLVAIVSLAVAGGLAVKNRAKPATSIPSAASPAEPAPSAALVVEPAPSAALVVEPPSSAASLGSVPSPVAATPSTRSPLRAGAGSGAAPRGSARRPLPRPSATPSASVPAIPQIL